MAASVQSFVNSMNANLEPPVRQHLKNVYACLTISSLSAAVGASVHLFTDIFEAGFLSGIGALVCFICLMMTADDDGKKLKQRMGLLLGFAFLTGVGLGPLLEHVAYVDPSIIVTSLVGTSVVFISFSLCSLLAQRGKWLYLGSILMTILNTMLVLSLANIFLGSSMLLHVHLYLGLVLMCGFVLYDTQVIIEKRRMGNRDFITHALDLFVDFIGIFRRILILLTEREEQSRKRRN